MTAPPRLTIGVTGLNATDNPGPGVAVLRSLRASARPGERLVGLTYDALDPGVYTRGLADASFLLPYPSSGAQAFLLRLRQVHERVGLDVIVPTLDAELPLFIALEPRLRAMGIALLLPTREQLALRAKAKLAALGKAAGIDVPATAIVASADELEHVAPGSRIRSSSRARSTAPRSRHQPRGGGRRLLPCAGHLGRPGDRPGGGPR